MLGILQIIRHNIFMSCFGKCVRCYKVAILSTQDCHVLIGRIMRFLHISTSYLKLGRISMFIGKSIITF